MGCTDLAPLVTTPGAAPTPFDLELVTLTRRELVTLRMQASQYRSLHSRAITRMQWLQRRHDHELAKAQAECTALRTQLSQAQALIRDLRQRVFGAKTEQSRSVNALATRAQPHTQRRRGQQPGARGHGRTRLTQLPVHEQHLRLSQPACNACGQALQELPGTQDAEVLEIQVKAYRRVVRRKRYRPVCGCAGRPGLVMPAVPAQLIPRGKLGVSVWVQALLSKFCYGQPSHRLLQDWADQGLRVAQGTLTEGLRRLAPLFAPLAQASLEQLRRASHWHADETRWEVFEERQGKLGHRWYLWVFKTEQVVCFVLDPSRSAAVPMRALAGVGPGVLSVDRYAAYRKYARHSPGVQLAICWAHQRRDFLRLANDHPALWDWAMRWVEQIGQLYALHASRRAHAADTQAAAFAQPDAQLRELLAQMSRQCEAGLHDAQLARPARKVLRTMRAYWPGLVLFLEHPHIGLDNNASERALRPAVVGRKNFYGSGSQWSGELAAAMLGLLATARLWGLNPRTWLTHYLHACAAEAGQAPRELSGFLPWLMPPARLALMRGACTIGSTIGSTSGPTTGPTIDSS